MPEPNKDLLYLLRILEAIGKNLLYPNQYNTAEEFLLRVFSLIKNDLPKLRSQISNCIKSQIKNGKFDITELEISKGSIFYQHINFSLLQ